ncbi:MAG TPA: hypothetical protein VFB54_19595, partial [Burkholderiales bacterium]|nr:hypothetical protein [Burkholderiales bacterium]
PAWYYLPRLALALLPWTFLLFVRRRSTRETATTNDTARFLRIASLVPLALLSFSSAKANYYAILCVPPLAILVALNVVTLARERRVRGFAFRVGAVVATFAAISFASLHYGLLTDVQSWIPPSALLVAAIVCLGTAAVGLAAANRWSAACVAVALISLPVTAFTVVVLKAEEPALSARAWIDAHEDLAAQQSWIFADFEAFSAVPFYAGTPVPVIDSRSRDLAFAQRLGYGEGMFVRSRDIPAPARGLVWYERRRQGELEATAIASRLSPLGCAGEQCVAALEPAKE